MDKSSMADVVESVLNERQNCVDQINDLKTKIKTWDSMIEGFQKLCDHKNPDGISAYIEYAHDSHKRYYRCKYCRHETEA